MFRDSSLTLSDVRGPTPGVVWVCGPAEVPVKGLVSPFTGQPLTSVPIGESWLAGVPLGTIGVAAGNAIDVGGRRFSCDVRGLQR